MKVVYSLRQPTRSFLLINICKIYKLINDVIVVKLRNNSPKTDLAGNGFVSTTDHRWLATRILPRLSWFLSSSFLRHLLPFPSFPSRHLHFPGISILQPFFLLYYYLFQNLMKHQPLYNTITIQFVEFNHSFFSQCFIITKLFKLVIS